MEGREGSREDLAHQVTQMKGESVQGNIKLPRMPPLQPCQSLMGLFMVLNMLKFELLMIDAQTACLLTAEGSKSWGNKLQQQLVCIVYTLSYAGGHSTQLGLHSENVAGGQTESFQNVGVGEGQTYINFPKVLGGGGGGKSLPKCSPDSIERLPFSHGDIIVEQLT